MASSSDQVSTSSTSLDCFCRLTDCLICNRCEYCGNKKVKCKCLEKSITISERHGSNRQKRAGVPLHNLEDGKIRKMKTVSPSNNATASPCDETCESKSPSTDSKNGNALDNLLVLLNIPLSSKEDIKFQHKTDFKSLPYSKRMQMTIFLHKVCSAAASLICPGYSVELLDEMIENNSKPQINKKVCTEKLLENMLRIQSKLPSNSLQRRAIRALLCGSLKHSQINEFLSLIDLQNSEENTEITQETEVEEHKKTMSTNIQKMGIKAFSNARRDFSLLFEGAELVKEDSIKKRTVKRMDDDAVERAVTYIFNHTNVYPLYWTIRRVSVDGQYHLLPLVSRRKTIQSIYSEYAEAFDKEQRICRSSFADVAKSITANGTLPNRPWDAAYTHLIYMNFLSLRRLINSKIQDEGIKEQVIGQIIWIENFVVYRYRHHISRKYNSENIQGDHAGCEDAIHSLDYALGKTNRELSVNCLECKNVFKVLYKIAEKMEMENSKRCIISCAEKVQLYMAHLVRNFNQNTVVEAQLNQSQCDEAILCLDFNYMWENRYKGRSGEKIKSNISWHGSLVIFRQKDGFLSKRYYDHIGLYSEKEASGAILSILEIVLTGIRKDFPHITKVSIQSPATTIYMNRFVLVFLHHLSKKTNIKISQYIYSQRLDGRSILHRHFFEGCQALELKLSQSHASIDSIVKPMQLYSALTSLDDWQTSLVEVISLHRERLSKLRVVFELIKDAAATHLPRSTHIKFLNDSINDSTALLYEYSNITLDCPISLDLSVQGMYNLEEEMNPSSPNQRSALQTCWENGNMLFLEETSLTKFEILRSFINKKEFKSDTSFAIFDCTLEEQNECDENFPLSSSHISLTSSPGPSTSRLFLSSFPAQQKLQHEQRQPSPSSDIKIEYCIGCLQRFSSKAHHLRHVCKGKFLSQDINSIAVRSAIKMYQQGNFPVQYADGIKQFDMCDIGSYHDLELKVNLAAGWARQTAQLVHGRAILGQYASDIDKMFNQWTQGDITMMDADQMHHTLAINYADQYDIPTAQDITIYMKEILEKKKKASQARNDVMNLSKRVRGRKGMCSIYREALMEYFVTKGGSLGTREAIDWMQTHFDKDSIGFPTDQQIHSKVHNMRNHVKRTGDVHSVFKEVQHASV